MHRTARIAEPSATVIIGDTHFAFHPVAHWPVKPALPVFRLNDPKPQDHAASSFGGGDRIPHSGSNNL
jgi:hypothetical protein